MELFINTALRHNALGLVDGDRVVEIRSWLASYNESEKVLGQLPDLLATHQSSLPELTGAYFVLGPGSFTALRIGLNMANVLHAMNGTPLQTLTTFELLQALYADQTSDILLEAGQDSVYHYAASTHEIQIIPQSQVADYPAAVVYLPKQQLPAPFLPWDKAWPQIRATSRPTPPPLEPLYVRLPHITHRLKNLF